MLIQTKNMSHFVGIFPHSRWNECQQIANVAPKFIQVVYIARFSICAALYNFNPFSFLIALTFDAI